MRFSAALPVLGGGSRASAAYRPDQAWRSSRPLENLAISRQLTSSDDPWETLAGGHFDAPPLERGEMRLARHEPPYGRHSPRHPVMGPVTLPCGRRLAPGKAHDRAAQGVRAPRGGTRASTFRENTNGSSGICVGCCLDEDARLAAALAQSLPSRQGGDDHRGAPPAYHGA